MAPTPLMVFDPLVALHMAIGFVAGVVTGVVLDRLLLPVALSAMARLRRRPDGQ